MANLNVKYGLPFCTVKILHKGKDIIIDNVLLDTGSGGTVFKMDIVDKIGITIESDDIIETISGVGGSEFVYKKDVDSVMLGEMELKDFKIEVGVMDYSFDINGILGMNFLKQVKAVINLDEMKITKNSKEY